MITRRALAVARMRGWVPSTKLFQGVRDELCARYNKGRRGLRLPGDSDEGE